MERRDFIKTCSIACVGTAAMSLILQGCTATNYFAQSTYSNNQLILSKKEFIQTINGKTGFREYVLLKTDRLQFPICIFRFDENEFSALLMECTHKGCELQPAGNYLACPCHGSEFSNRGEVQNPPAEKNLISYLITSDHENIYIQI